MALSLSTGMRLGLTGNAAGGAPAFTPVANDRLHTWFHADTAGKGAGTIDANGAGNVSEWRDPRGNGRKLTQALGSLQPVTGSGTTLNGKNVITTNNDLMTGAVSIDATLPIYHFQVGNYGTKTDPAMLDLTGTGGLRIGFIGRVIVRNAAADVFTGNPTASTAILSEYHHINSIANSFDRYEDGVQITPQFPRDVASGKFTAGDTLTTRYLFDDSSGGNAWTGYAAEDRLYVGALTPQEILDIRAEMNAEWGL